MEVPAERRSTPRGNITEDAENGGSEKKARRRRRGSGDDYHRNDDNNHRKNHHEDHEDYHHRLEKILRLLLQEKNILRWKSVLPELQEKRISGVHILTEEEARAENQN